MSVENSPGPAAPTPPAISELPVDHALRAEVSNRGYNLGAGESSFTADQHRVLIQMAVEDGHLPLGEANKMLAEQNLSPLVAPKFDEPATEREIVEQNFAGAKPHEYILPPLAEKDRTSIEANASDAKFRNWLATGEFSKDMGTSLAEAARHESRQLSAMKTPEEFSAWRDSQRRTIENVWGDKKNEKFAAIGHFLQTIETKSPGVTRYLNETGLSHSATILSMLSTQAEVLSMKRGK